MSAPATTEQPPAPAVDTAPRCWNCGRKLAVYVGRPWRLICQKCKAQNGRDRDASQAGPAVLE